MHVTLRKAGFGNLVRVALPLGGPALGEFHRTESWEALGSDAESRSAPRFTLLLRTAKLVADGREFLCILRDASATGVKVRIFHPIPDHTLLQLELGNGERFPIELVWMTKDHAGFRFLGEVQVQRLIDDANGTFPKRQLRLRISLPAMLHSGGSACPVSFRDISQQGACIECDKWLMMNELVRIDTGVLPSIYAKVRWRSQPRYGLIFEHPFRLDELARVSAPLQLAEAVEQAEAVEPESPAVRKIL